MRRPRFLAGLAALLVALAHQLLSPKTRTVLVTSSPLDPGLAHRAGLDADASTVAGAARARAAAVHRPAPAAAGRGGRREVRRERGPGQPRGPRDRRGSPARGSAADDGGVECKPATDLAAARQVFEASSLPVLQIPAEEYRRFCPFTLRQVRKLLDDGRHGEPIDGRQVRLAHSLDPRLNLADFLALLRAHARHAA
jgi:hypothetical protein